MVLDNGSDNGLFNSAVIPGVLQKTKEKVKSEQSTEYLEQKKRDQVSDHRIFILLFFFFFFIIWNHSSISLHRDAIHSISG